MKNSLFFTSLLSIFMCFQLKAQKPTYTFTCKIYVNEATAQYYGGHSAIENLIKGQFTSVNQIYNAESRFTGIYKFVPSVFSYYTESGANRAKMDQLFASSPETGYNYRIIYSRTPYITDPNANQNILADYQVTTRSIRFALNAEAEWSQTLFGTTPTRILSHELGHARGAADLYSTNLNGSNNGVFNNVGYNYPVPSIMNYLYDLSAGWDTHSIACMNASASTILTESTWKTLFWSLFPSKISIRVKSNTGVPLANAKVTLYGIRWMTASLSSSDAFVYYTDAQGYVSFSLSTVANNPFQQSSVFSVFSNFMVVAEYQGAGQYNWMPVFDVQTAKINGQTEYVIDYAFNVSTNLALGKTAKASSTKSTSTTANYAVDGSSSTVWTSAASNSQWIYVDLGASYQINRVKINWTSTGYGKTYKIQTSTNASSWTDIKSVSNNAALVNDWTGLSGTGRYVRISASARGTSNGYSISELEVYAPGTARVELADTDNDGEAVMAAYPNPAKDFIVLPHVSEALSNQKVEFIGMNGQSYGADLNVVSNNETIQISHLPSGLYIARIKTLEGTHQYSFVKE